MHAHWNPPDQQRWDAFAHAAGAGLQQSWAYGQALQTLHVPCLRVALTAEPEPQAPWVGAAQFIVHRLPWFVRFAFSLGGPIWVPGADLHTQRAGLRLMRRTLPLRRPRVAIFTPPLDTRDPAAPPHAFRGQWALATGGSTVILDLTLDEATRLAQQEGRWRNRLNAAQRSGLRVDTCGTKPRDVAWLVDAESQQRQARRYIALPEGFVAAFQAASPRPAEALLTLAAFSGRERCAGMMFLVHGRSATYHLGWTNETGRELSAHNLLLWEACQRLAARGVERLDLGGVDTTSNPGLARFKLGTGGQVITWAGSFL